MANRNSADTEVLMMPPMLLRPIEVQGRGGQRDAGGRQDHHSGVAHGEEEAHGHRALALLHQLAGDVVDGRDVVGVHGVPQTEAVGQQRGAEQHRLMAKDQERPGPHRLH